MFSANGESEGSGIVTLVGIVPRSAGVGNGKGVGDAAVGLAARVAGEGDALGWERFASALGKLARHNKQRRRGFFQKSGIFPGRSGEKV
jgi:hypothetical protein